MLYYEKDVENRGDVMRLSKEQFLFLFSESIVFKGAYTEISFQVADDPDYTECWMGKMPAPDGRQEDIYWYCLKTDGSEGYYYTSLHKLLEAKVFHGKTIVEIIGSIFWESLEGSPFEELLSYYLTME